MSDAERLLAAVHERIVGRQPRTTGWTTPAGWWIGWSTEPMGHDAGDPPRWSAFCYRPTGDGSRGDVKALQRRMNSSGVSYRLVRETYRRTRKGARRQALRWYVARLAQEARMSGLPEAQRQQAQRTHDRWSRVEW